MTGAPSALPVLMYHAVTEVRGPLRDLGVPAALLHEHLHALRAAGYRVVGLTEALDSADMRVPTVALTFDDAYADFVDALPILAAYGASATLYVPVEHVGSTAGWLGDRSGDFAPILGWPELRAVASAGIEIGNHGLRHEPMDLIRPAELSRQTRVSSDRIADEIGAPVRSFAYPHGYHGAAVRAAVRATGHDNACEVGRRVARPADDRFALPRLQPTPDVSAERLLAMVRGRATVMPAVKRLAQPGWRLTRRLARTAGVRLT
jgi:peptidoglycan/xylan/chitin deacetylase (PgdA/CDA1 family)